MTPSAIAHMANNENYLKECEEAEKKADILRDERAKIYEHIDKRVKEIHDHKERVFYSLEMAGSGIFVRLDGLFDYRFLVPENPKYLSVDNMLERVFWAGGVQKSSLIQTRPFSILVEDSGEGDVVREKLFKAYNMAINVYEWCRENKKTIFEFAVHYNQEFGTLFDFELEKFFMKKT